MEGLHRSIRVAVRALRRTPSLTASVVLTLALCIGGTAAVFGAVYAVLFRPLPWAQPARVMLVRELWRGQVGAMSVGNWADFGAATGCSNTWSRPIPSSSTWRDRPAGERAGRSRRRGVTSA